MPPAMVPPIMVSPNQRQLGCSDDSLSVQDARAANDFEHQAASGHASRPATATATAKVIVTKASGPRLLAPDLLRGLLMLLMALDHAAVLLQTWPHGTGRVMEADGAVVKRFNFPTAYIIRTLTHLCAPGFTFLLGMGLVYLCRSRIRLGWSAARLTKYIVQRTLALTIATSVMGLLLTGGLILFLNIILFALAIDYLLAGLLCLAFNKTESLLAGQVARLIRDAGHGDAGHEQQPLLQSSTGSDMQRKSKLASSISWHIHNAILVVLSAVTIAWNIWLSNDHGHCLTTTQSASIQERNNDTAHAAMTPPQNPWLRIWFWSVRNSFVMSEFPPLAWLSFAVLGLLYGRILVARSWHPRSLIIGQILAGLFFTLIFIATRLLRIGNLSEDCLQTKAQQLHPDANPYLVSADSFFYTIKYPPDVAFRAMTMAGNFFLLAGLGAIPAHASKRFTMLLDFGTSALFFYFSHLLLLHIMALVLVPLFGHDTGVPGPTNPDVTQGIDNIVAYFAIWGVAMLILWPVCRLYSRFKSQKPADSIWRFF